LTKSGQVGRWHGPCYSNARHENSHKHLRATFEAALLASTTAVLILVLAGVLFAAELEAPGNLAVPGAPTTLTGSLHTLYGDAPRGGGHMHMHVLVDDKGGPRSSRCPTA
jgi:hypothetical protein